MAKVEQSIDVNVPVSTAYNQWTQFEEFPAFMEGIKSVEQMDDKRLRWKAEIAGKKEEWIAEIMEQFPDRRIAWRSIVGAGNAGVVTFHRIDEDTTRVMLQLETEASGPVEALGEKLGVLERRVKGDLERFKDFIEARQRETGAWRGTIKGDQVQSSGAG